MSVVSALEPELTPAEFKAELAAMVARFGQKLNDNQIIEGLQSELIGAHIQAEGDVLLDGVPATVLCSVGEWAWVVKDRDPSNPETVSINLLTKDAG